MAEPNWGPTGKTVYERTYQRVKPNGEKETWEDTVRRVAAGNLSLVYGPPETWSAEVDDEYRRLVQGMLDFKILPAGRHLWASGVKGRQYLFNCVSGDTMIHTASGLIPIRELAGRTVDVLSQDATYRPATFYHYGDQEIFTVSLSNGEVIEATAGHEWVTYNSGAFYRHTTTELLGKRVPLNVAPRPEEDEDYRRGVAWGMVYGDGAVTSTKKSALVLFGPKVALAAHVEGFGTSTAVHDKRRTDDNLRVNGLPIEWKLTLPELTASRSLWRGFIAGLIATDGHVNGNVTLYSSDRGALAHIAKGAAYAGIPPRRIRMVREFSPFDGSRKPCYALGLTKWALTPQDILREDHLEKIEFPPKASVRTLRVTDVKATGRIERVYCCTEEETHTMTVGSGILTGQCHVAGWGDKLSDHFKFTFLRLMEGGGVGSNYSTRYLEPYGPPRRALRVHIVCSPDHPDWQSMRDAGLLSTEFSPEWAGAYPVEDSREGWADALVDLIDTYMTDGEVRHLDRVYDVSRVRPEGSPLRTFGGTASGPLPFASMMRNISQILNASCPVDEWAPPYLKPLEAMRIDHEIGACVVAGGNRRSARMSMIRWNDPYVMDFIRCKTDTGEHWTTNISVEIDDNFIELLSSDGIFGNRAREVHKAVVTGMLTNGEPGYWNSSLSNEGEPTPVVCTNPCGEIALAPWENCNLGHVNLDAFAINGRDEWAPLGRRGVTHAETQRIWQEAAEAHRLMTRFLIRATCGDVSDPRQAEVLARQRRIGVGHFGVQGFLAKSGIPYSAAPDDPWFKSFLRYMYRSVRQEARRYAFQLHIPEPVKVTAVAPTGTIAKLAGRTEGIHPVYARRFIRRVRFSSIDPDEWATVMRLVAEGHHAEPDLAAANTWVVEFPTTESLVAEVEALGLDPVALVESADEIPLDRMLAMQALYQECYADNAVSFTCNLPAEPHQATAMAAGQPVPPPSPERVDEVAATLATWMPRLKGTTIMVDGARPQAPYERLTEAQWAELSGPTSVADSVDEECANGACPVR